MRHERQGLHFAFREPSLHVGTIAVAVFLVEHTRCVMEDIRQGVAAACDSLGCVDPFCERFLSVHGAFKLAFQQRFALCQRIDFPPVVVFAVDDIDRFSRELAVSDCSTMPSSVCIARFAWASAHRKSLASSADRATVQTL